MKIPGRLNTERLILRPYEEDDFAAFYDFLCDPAATRFLRFTDEQKSRHGASAFFDEVLASYAGHQPIFALAIIHKEKKDYIGSCGFSPLSDGTGLECYYAISPDHWGQGFAVEAVTAIFNYAFSELRIDRIVALVHPENHSSRKVAEELGMTYQDMIFDKEAGMNVDYFLLRRQDHPIA